MLCAFDFSWLAIERQQNRKKNRAIKKWRSQHEKKVSEEEEKRTLCVYIHHSRSVKKQVLEFVQRLSLILHHHRDTLGLFSPSLFLLARLEIYIAEYIFSIIAHAKNIF